MSSFVVCLVLAVSPAATKPVVASPFPYGRDHASAQAIYHLLRTRTHAELDQIERTLHRRSRWLAELSDEIGRRGFDPHAPAVQQRAAELLERLMPFRYPPVQPAAPSMLQPGSVAAYEPVHGRVYLAAEPGRWPLSVSLLHEATHALQSAPGPVGFALLRQAPWSARTWTYSATRENPKALRVAVECGPSLLTGLAIAELSRQVLPPGPELRCTLSTPAGRMYSTRWLLLAAHRYGLFGDNPTARALGVQHARVVGINELLGGGAAGRQFVASLLPTDR